MFVMPAPKNAKNMRKWVWSIARNVQKLVANVLPLVKKWLQQLNLIFLPGVFQAGIYNNFP
ncbi:MAG: hypothetical protein BGO69_14840 [Bacteroidetes bacterium 46-16]|nr:MAG: hypothetical protein BGO69_14840 [Bacteroidetes bacterium 46-16]